TTREKCSIAKCLILLARPGGGGRLNLSEACDLRFEGQITRFYNDTMLQACNVTERRIAENNFEPIPAVAHQRESAGDQHHFLQDRALAAWHGSRPRHLGIIRYCRCHLPDHREALS